MINKMVKWFTPFIHVVPAEYETWFENLAADGWHPNEVGQFSSMKMTFLKSEPKKYRYVVDLQAIPKKEYKSTYQDFGWEFVGQMSSIFVWRKEYTDKRPESFSDNESLQKRNKRFLTVISVMFSMFLLSAIGITIVYPVFFTRLGMEQHINYILALAVSYIFSFLFGCVLKKIYQNKNR